MLSELQWKPTITVRSGIGQGVTLVTPVAVARYASAIANRGTVYDVHIVDRILDSEGKLVKEIEPSVYNRIGAPEEYWDAIHQGLRGVMSPEDRGTAAGAFTPEFEEDGYQDLIIGKTGTAQTTTANQVDIENTSWFITFTPKDKPEIAIVVSIPNGYSGSSSAPAVEEIVRYYIDKSRSSAPENLVDVNALVP
jgi:penicillin-binding protein 2